MEQSKIVKIMIRVISMCCMYSGDTTIECDLQSGKNIGKFKQWGSEKWIPIPISQCWANAINEKKIIRLMKSRSHRLTEEELRMFPTDMPIYTIMIEYHGKVHEISGYRYEIIHIPLFDEMIDVYNIGCEFTYPLYKSCYDVAAKQPWFEGSDMYFSDDETTQKAWYVWRTLFYDTEKPTTEQIEEVCNMYEINFYDAMKYKNRFKLKIINNKY